MLTEGMKELDGEALESGNKENDEEDYLDEYGNLKEDTKEVGVENVGKESDTKKKTKKDTKNFTKSSKEKGKKNPNKNYSDGWKDLDSEVTETEQGKEYVSSRVKIPDWKLMFPRDSSLDWYEQETFLFKQCQARAGQLTPESGAQWMAYQNFLSLVTEEQEEFNRFTRDVYQPTPSSVGEDHRKYVTEHRAARLPRALSLPRWWTKLRDVRLAGASEEQVCALTLEQTLIELGTRPKANLPCLIRNVRGTKTCHGMSLPSQYLRMVHKVPPDPSVQPGTIGLTRGQERRKRLLGESQAADPDMEVKVDSSKYLYKESCIDDVNCALLAQLVVPDVIVSTAAIKCLMDNHRPHFNKTWEIPFVVRTFQSQVDTRTVVIFGKPLLSREVTDEDFSVLAHKIAVQVGLFQRDWEAMAVKKTKLKQPERVSPEEDLFGSSDVCMEELEVFGDVSKTKSLVSLYQKAAADEDVIAQVDGGDTDSDELVISESPRRSKRMRMKEKTSESESEQRAGVRGRGKKKGSSSQTVRRSTRSNASQGETSAVQKDLFGPDTSLESDELLDYEPDEIPKTGPSHRPSFHPSSSSDDDESNDDDVQSLLQKKIELAKESEQAATKAESEAHSTSSSSEEDEEETKALLEKKLQAIRASAGGSVEEKKNSDSSSQESSDSEDEGQNLFQKKMAAMMVKDTKTAEEIEEKVEEMVTEESEEVLPPASSPKKKVQRILSSESEEETGEKEKEAVPDPITKKLAELGRENVDVKKLQKKISLEKKLKIMSEQKQRKISVQNEDRDQRVSQRNQSEVAADKEEEKEEETSDEKSLRKLLPTSSDSEEEEGRFDKFSGSRTDGSQPNLLDNLLTGQNKLLSSDGRKRVEEKPQKSQAVFEKMSVVAPGLPGEQVKPPLPGTNVSYRLWRLYDKAGLGGRDKGLRVVVRSKVAGVTKEDRVVTPSVKVEHQSEFGAEQVTASQVTREWISTLVRPNSSLSRVRVLPSSKLVMIEEKSLPELTAECRKLNSDPGKQLVNLFNIFSELKTQKAGQYILKHSSKTGAFCEVYEVAGEEKAGAGVLDLHKMYSTLQPGDTVPGKLPYCPIDPSVVTPWHTVNGRVPATFQPAGDRPRASNRGRGGGRGGRGGARGGGRGGGAQGGDKGGRGGKGRGRGRGKKQ